MPDCQHALFIFKSLEQALAADVELPPLVGDALSDLLIAYSAAAGVDDRFTTDSEDFERWFGGHWQRQPLFVAEANDISLAQRAAWHLIHQAQRGRATDG